MKNAKIWYLILVLTVISAAGCKMGISGKEEYLISSKNYFNLTSIEVEQNNNKAVIVKRDNNWELLGKENSIEEKERAKYLVESLKKLKMERNIFFEENLKKQFGDSRKNIKVKIYINGRFLKEFIIGNSDSKNMRCYIKIGQDIYVVNRLLYNIFNSSF